MNTKCLIVNDVMYILDEDTGVNNEQLDKSL